MNFYLKGGGDFLYGAVNFLLLIRKIPEKQVLCLQVIHNLSSSITIIANFSKLQFESLLKDVSKYILRLLYHHYIVKVFILEKKSGLSISLNLVKQSFQCFHPEPNPKISIPFNCQLQTYKAVKGLLNVSPSCPSPELEFAGFVNLKE